MPQPPPTELSPYHHPRSPLRPGRAGGSMGQAKPKRAATRGCEAMVLGGLCLHLGFVTSTHDQLDGLPFHRETCGRSPSTWYAQPMNVCHTGENECSEEMMLFCSRCGLPTPGCYNHYTSKNTRIRVAFRVTKHRGHTRPLQREAASVNGKEYVDWGNGIQHPHHQWHPSRVGAAGLWQKPHLLGGDSGGGRLYHLWRIGGSRARSGAQGAMEIINR